MTVKFYVDKFNGDINGNPDTYTEQDYRGMIEESARDLMYDKEFADEFFELYAKAVSPYTNFIVHLLDFCSLEEQQKIYKDFYTYCLKKAEEYAKEEFFEIFVEM